MKKIEFDCRITPAWDLIEKVEQNTQELFKVTDKSLKEATIMVATELLENAVKYGRSHPGIDGIQFHFIADDDFIRISVSNAVLEDHHKNDLIETIDEVNKCENPEILYMNRLKELLESRVKGVSRLGLYRIAYEGQFNLSYKLENDLLTVIAEKHLN